jgi:signal transduction histidine kinase
MDVKALELRSKRELNNVMCLIGIIPFGVFVYLLVVRIGSLSILTGETGYIMFITTVILMLGIVAGRKMLLEIINRLFEFNQTIIKLQGQLIEKSRLAAVTETALSLSHEVNNPLLIMRGNIDLLESELVPENQAANIQKRIVTIKTNCERIRQVTEKMSTLTKPKTTVISGDVKMIDLPSSE